MIEMYPYGATAHHVAKMLRAESFPLSREELADRYGDRPIKVSKDEVVPFRTLLGRMGLDRYETAVSFYAALNAAL